MLYTKGKWQNLKESFNISGKQVTGDPAFSMFNLSLREDWVNNKKFCHRLSDDEDEEEEANGAAQEALERLAANKSRQSSPNGTQLCTGGSATATENDIPGPGRA
jgi:hypothetical protein